MGWQHIHNFRFHKCVPELFLIRTVFLNKVKKQLKKGEKADKCFLTLFWPFSLNLKNLRKRNKRINKRKLNKSIKNENAVANGKLQFT